MPNFAQVTLIGHLGRKPESKKTPSGDTVTSFSLATNKRRRDGDLTTWWNCTAWRKTGELIAQYFDKGDPILIVGEPSQRPYTTQDGREGVALDVEVQSFTFMGRADGAQGAPGGQSRPSGRQDARDAYSASQAAQAPSGGGPTDYDDDIPFDAYQRGWVV